MVRPQRALPDGEDALSELHRFVISPGLTVRQYLRIESPGFLDLRRARRRRSILRSLRLRGGRRPSPTTAPSQTTPHQRHQFITPLLYRCDARPPAPRPSPTSCHPPASRPSSAHPSAGTSSSYYPPPRPAPLDPTPAPPLPPTPAEHPDLVPLPHPRPTSNPLPSPAAPADPARPPRPAAANLGQLPEQQIPAPRHPCRDAESSPENLHTPSVIRLVIPAGRPSPPSALLGSHPAAPRRRTHPCDPRRTHPEPPDTRPRSPHRRALRRPPSTRDPRPSATRRRTRACDPTPRASLRAPSGRNLRRASPDAGHAPVIPAERPPPPDTRL